MTEELTEIGSVYLIVNPAWPEQVKVGKAKNMVRRLGQYQTYCPDAGYILAYAYAVRLEDMDRAEKHAHAALKHWLRRGEWYDIDTSHCVEILNKALAQFECGLGFDTLLEKHTAEKNEQRMDRYWSDPEKYREQRRETDRAHYERNKEELRETKRQRNADRLAAMDPEERRAMERERKAAYRARKRQEQEK